MYLPFLHYSLEPFFRSEAKACRRRRSRVATPLGAPPYCVAQPLFLLAIARVLSSSRTEQREGVAAALFVQECYCSGLGTRMKDGRRTDLLAAWEDGNSVDIGYWSIT